MHSPAAFFFELLCFLPYRKMIPRQKFRLSVNIFLLNHTFQRLRTSCFPSGLIPGQPTSRVAMAASCVFSNFGTSTGRAIYRTRPDFGPHRRFGHLCLAELKENQEAQLVFCSLAQVRCVCVCVRVCSTAEGGCCSRCLSHATQATSCSDGCRLYFSMANRLLVAKRSSGGYMQMLACGSLLLAPGCNVSVLAVRIVHPTVLARSLVHAVRVA